MKSEVSSVLKTSLSDDKESLSPMESFRKQTDNKFSLDKTQLSALESKMKDTKLINETSNYSKEVNQFIRIPAEIQVYQNANLSEGIVNDRLVLKTNEINPNLVDAMGRTNLERMGKGLSAIDETGNSFNLHHIGQKMNSPLAELKQSEHNIYDNVLHDKTIKTEIHNDSNENIWNGERKEHWKTRAIEIKEKFNV